MKLWTVTVNNWGWNWPKTVYAKSRQEAQTISNKFPASSVVKYAGNYSDDKAEWLLSDSTEPFWMWLQHKSW